MWQKPLLLGNKNRNIDAVYPKQTRFTCLTLYKLENLCIDKEDFSAISIIK